MSDFSIYTGLGRIQGSLLRHWSRTALECYKRGCVCKDCPNSEIESFQNGGNKCHVKAYVIGYIINGMYPPDEEKFFEST